MLIVQQWIIALTFALPVLKFIQKYGRLYLPKQVNEIDDSAQILTIQTYNVLSRNRVPDKLVAVICEISADIVALQELSAPVQQHIIKLDQYQHKALHGLNDDSSLDLRSTMGQGILSRFPILEDEYWVHDYLPIPLGHQRVLIDVNGQKIAIYNVHPIHPGMTFDSFYDSNLRNREVLDLLQRIQSETVPVIMLGDHNLTDLSDEYAQITSVLTDTHFEVGKGMGLTFPDYKDATMQDTTDTMPDYLPQHPPLPQLLRLDYVFHSEEFTGVQMYVHHTSGGSDHRPLVVKLALDNTE